MCSEQFNRIFKLDQGVPMTLEVIRTRVHPEDIRSLNGMIYWARGAGNDSEYEHHFLVPDRLVGACPSFGHYALQLLRSPLLACSAEFTLTSTLLYVQLDYFRVIRELRRRASDKPPLLYAIPEHLL